MLMNDNNYFRLGIHVVVVWPSDALRLLAEVVILSKGFLKASLFSDGDASQVHLQVACPQMANYSLSSSSSSTQRSPCCRLASEPWVRVRRFLVVTEEGVVGDT